mmetsp:Transcript_351/g.832  ORF Transcript_351/g.832 Transcript_351/m.832 type:complete len:405 (-) Transcript_351:199-1413(-)
MEGREEEVVVNGVGGGAEEAVAVAPPPLLPAANDNESSYSGNVKQKSSLRSGRWFPEEELYCQSLITAFKNGTLPIPDKTRLRDFLSRVFHCDPMRISKKYEGQDSVGKLIFRRQEEAVNSAGGITLMQLKALERDFLNRMATSKSPSAQAASEKIMEYSSVIYGNHGDLVGYVGEGVFVGGEVVGGDLNTVVNKAVKQSRKRKEMQGVSYHQGYGQYQQPQMNPLIKLRMEQVYNLSMANVLFVQKMLVDSKQKHISMEYKAAEVPSHITQRAVDNVKGKIINLENQLEDMKSAQRNNNNQDQAEDIKSMDQLEREANYHTAVANLLSLQQMTMSTEYKFLDLEIQKMELEQSNASEARMQQNAEALKAMADGLEELGGQKRDVMERIDELYGDVLMRMKQSA